MRDRSTPCNSRLLDRQIRGLFRTVSSLCKKPAPANRRAPRPDATPLPTSGRIIPSTAWTGRRPTHAVSGLRSGCRRKPSGSTPAEEADGKTFPWGADPPSRDLLNFNNNIGSTTRVGSYPSGISPFGLHDMSGNVQEWTGDFYAANYYSDSPTTNPPGTDGRCTARRARSSWKLGIPQEVLTTTVRFAFVPSTRDPSLGFRCAADAPPTP